MKQGLYAVPMGATVLTLVAQPLWAAPIQVTAIQLQPTASGIQLTLSTKGNGPEDAPPSVFTVNSGNSAVADVAGAQLRLAGGKPFRQNNPAPGITEVIASQLDTNTIRVVVSGIHQAPAGRVIRRNGSSVVLDFTSSPVAQAKTPANPRSSQPNLQPSGLTPPLLPRAVAPPVGDIAVAPIDVSPETIDLGTSERIPKLLLREAPAREVLTLLGRAANINVAFAEGSAETPSGTGTQEGTPGTGTQEGTPETGTTEQTAETAGKGAGEATISLDIEDESVQDVFNYVLRLSGLQANKVGRTVFVGKILPTIAQNRILRTYRLNQIKATGTGTITQTFTSQAETGGSVSAGSSSGGASVTSGATAQTAINRTTTTTRSVVDRGAKEILESYGANSGGTGSSETQVSSSSGGGTGSSETQVSSSSGGGTGSSGRSRSTLLRDLEVIADARANTVTLIGSPRVVQIATDLLTQLDIRRRQAAVNVKIVDVDLTKGRNAGADVVFNSTNTITSGFINGIFQIGAVLGDNFLLNLATSIQDDSAKILTNPTLIVQEGSSAQVNLTQEIFSGIERTETTTEGTTNVTETPIIRPAGVILNLNVDQVDDNGFITLNIAPEVSAPNGTFTFSGGTGTLLAQRRLETGQIRLRDGQTLILTGIIQDSDTSEIDKVPILGDIPLLGRLFRRENKSRERREVVVIVTPQVLDDSNQATFGYQYTPSPEAQKLLNPKR